MTRSIRFRSFSSRQIVPVVMVLATLAFGTFPGRSVATAEEPASEYSPVLEQALDAPQKAMLRFRLPRGLKASLFAAEPMLANPVAFTFDEQGRVYVAETFRHFAGVSDNRWHMEWLDNDLANRTTEDRVAMFQKYLGDEFATIDREHERIRLLEDTDGDGLADQSTVFADGFNDPADGIGAGLLAKDGNVWFTCIPHLWLLRDEDQDGKADVRQALQSGYGVHVAFIGHDLHGLCFGPDGRIYFSVGDRGLNVTKDGQTFTNLDSGAVLRSNPDGTNLEVFATGLRNPQELVFDEFGNLFTGDNNSDSGDKARFVQVLEGSDSGWRIGYQYITSPVARGPWNAERMWEPQCAEQPAYIVPPIANIADGPSGLAYYPGTGLSSDYAGRFLLCDFRGISPLSGIRTFRVQPKGAGFELVDQQNFMQAILATDVEFGADGAVYVLDWVEGWDLPRRGRIYRVYDPKTIGDEKLLEVRKLLASSLRERSIEELAELLAHADQRVRQRAQFALVDKGNVAVDALNKTAKESSNRLARVHAIWALGQLGRQESAILQPLVDLTRDSDVEVRSASIAVLTDARYGDAFDAISKCLADPEPRVRMYAALGIGKLGRREAVEPLLVVLRDNADQDPSLRHAAVMGLVGSADVETLVASADDSSASVRMGILLALRRHQSAEIERFLHDADPRLVEEAARAIYDVPIDGALPALAALINEPASSNALARRVISANSRLGGAPRAKNLASFALKQETPEPLRIEALDCLWEWTSPSGRDRMVGLWRPIARDSGAMEDVAAAIRPVAEQLLTDASKNIRRRGAELCGIYKIREAAGALAKIVASSDESGSLRAIALDSLAQLDIADLLVKDVFLRAAEDQDAALRAKAASLLAKVDADSAIAVLRRALTEGPISEQQAAMATLGAIANAEAEALLAQSLDRLLAGQLPPEVELDLLEAAVQCSSDDIRARIDKFEASRSAGSAVSQYREALAGGNAQRGERIFYDKTALSCLRCHRHKNRGGMVGPDLTKVAEKQTREYLLEAIVEPNRAIAKGFETVVVVTDAGQVHVGILKLEDDQQLQLLTAEGQLVSIEKRHIDERSTGISAMPDKLRDQLTKSELRDLVEFLAHCK